MLESLWQWFLVPANEMLLLGIIAGFGLGLIIGARVRGVKEAKVKSIASNGDKAFFKGIRYILSNDHDHAIEEFTKSVQLNSETIETYVALGNLYRSKGDIERAIRIRQSIILRQNIDEKIRIEALFDLGLDYRKGGFLSRALETFLRVAQADTSNVRTLKEIEKIYEELKDWENAFRTRQKIAKLAKGDHQNILAHQLVEIGKIYQEKGDLTKAKSFYNKAISAHTECVDAYLHLGDLYFGKQEYRKAISIWKKVVEVSPRFTFLAYSRLEGAYSRMKDLKPVGDFLKECAKSDSDAFTHMALARYMYNENDVEGALEEIATVLEIAPSFWEARRFKGEILLSLSKEKDALVEYGEIVEHVNMPYLRFQCSQCGFQSSELQWQCPQCRNWDTIGLVESAGFLSESR
ncbi:MAG: tetratricopeptide repeat protein [Thermodesulfobacteriota bacterium]|nr:tetratricopeptide repeat protein [Thermodesulfobacteriota bacterium]